MVKWCRELRKMRLEKCEVWMNDFAHPFSETIKVIL